jgi:hypothetical protein
MANKFCSCQVKHLPVSIITPIVVCTLTRYNRSCQSSSLYTVPLAFEPGRKRLHAESSSYRSQDNEYVVRSQSPLDGQPRVYAQHHCRQCQHHQRDLHRKGSSIATRSSSIPQYDDRLGDSGVEVPTNRCCMHSRTRLFRVSQVCSRLHWRR